MHTALQQVRALTDFLFASEALSVACEFGSLVLWSRPLLQLLESRNELFQFEGRGLGAICAQSGLSCALKYSVSQGVAQDRRFSQTWRGAQSREVINLCAVAKGQACRRLPNPRVETRKRPKATKQQEPGSHRPPQQKAEQQKSQKPMLGVLLVLTTQKATVTTVLCELIPQCVGFPPAQRNKFLKQLQTSHHPHLPRDAPFSVSFMRETRKTKEDLGAIR